MASTPVTDTLKDIVAKRCLDSGDINALPLSSDGERFISLSRTIFSPEAAEARERMIVESEESMHRSVLTSKVRRAGASMMHTIGGGGTMLSSATLLRLARGGTEQNQTTSNATRGSEEVSPNIQASPLFLSGSVAKNPTDASLLAVALRGVNATDAPPPHPQTTSNVSAWAEGSSAAYTCKNAGPAVGADVGSECGLTVTNTFGAASVTSVSGTQGPPQNQQYAPPTSLTPSSSPFYSHSQSPFSPNAVARRVFEWQQSDLGSPAKVLADPAVQALLRRPHEEMLDADPNTLAIIAAAAGPAGRSLARGSGESSEEETPLLSAVDGAGKVEKPSNSRKGKEGGGRVPWHGLVNEGDSEEGSSLSSCTSIVERVREEAETAAQIAEAYARRSGVRAPINIIRYISDISVASPLRMQDVPLWRLGAHSPFPEGSPMGSGGKVKGVSFGQPVLFSAAPSPYMYCDRSELEDGHRGSALGQGGGLHFPSEARERDPLSDQSLSGAGGYSSSSSPFGSPKRLASRAVHSLCVEEIETRCLLEEKEVINRQLLFCEIFENPSAACDIALTAVAREEFMGRRLIELEAAESLTESMSALHWDLNKSGAAGRSQICGYARRYGGGEQPTLSNTNGGRSQREIVYASAAESLSAREKRRCLDKDANNKPHALDEFGNLKRILLPSDMLSPTTASDKALQAISSLTTTSSVPLPRRDEKNATTCTSVNQAADLRLYYSLQHVAHKETAARSRLVVAELEAYISLGEAAVTSMERVSVGVLTKREQEDCDCADYSAGTLPTTAESVAAAEQEFPQSGDVPSEAVSLPRIGIVTSTLQKDQAMEGDSAPTKPLTPRPPSSSEQPSAAPRRPSLIRSPAPLTTPDPTVEDHLASIERRAPASSSPADDVTLFVAHARILAHDESMGRGLMDMEERHARAGLSKLLKIVTDRQ